MIIEVHIEWPGGSETEEVELPDGSSEEDQAEAAKDAFFNSCNYGYDVKEAE